ncbi:thiamine-triphosphatase isoform X2 [Acipenser ruthenus]|nr:thiamine-triphosphatase isoform X2 [Acipenser ruthenus]XP_058872964.1 thiamine-triphosphatase isoform X2 [Acipenser ruthenus]XP_058872965.1 thiamine-triphosphatase isoform X2 [Acipenser ruthenus]
MSVEVERKFVCRSDTETRLKELGAQFVGERSFHDRYFDTEQFTLTLSDTWLRCRGACWELKCPVRVREGEEEEEEKGRERGGGGGGGGEGRNIKLCTRYREITELSEIVDRVRQVVLREKRGEGEREREILKEGEGERSCKTEAEKEGEGRGEREKEGKREGRGEGEKEGEREGRWERQTDSAWLGEFALVQFASFTTVRRSYILQGGVRADLDLVDFGFAVGELEVLVETPEQIPAGAERIAELVEKLGLSEACKNRVPGKMDAYLKQFHPEHYGRLLRAHKLHP